MAGRNDRANERSTAGASIWFFTFREIREEIGARHLGMQSQAIGDRNVVSLMPGPRVSVIKRDRSPGGFHEWIRSLSEECPPPWAVGYRRARRLFVADSASRWPWRRVESTQRVG